jgi:hypothetical protein
MEAYLDEGTSLIEPPDLLVELGHNSPAWDRISICALSVI